SGLHGHSRRVIPDESGTKPPLRAPRRPPIAFNRGMQQPTDSDFASNHSDGAPVSSRPSLRGWARLVLLAAAGLSGVVGTSGCGAISRLNFIPVEEDALLGAEAYPQLLESEQLITSGADYSAVVEMTDRLVESALVIDPEIASLFDWEVKLVRRDDLVNAWCLPGGKMAVYTGILPVAAGGDADLQTGLAVVMGHEIAHATLRHGTRAMTRQMTFNGVALLAALLIGEGAGEEKGQWAGLIGTAVASFANRSYGRDAELEADRRGLTYMAHAGYDPREAVEFWRRMNAVAGGAAPPEWLSTHPSNERRIAQIQELLPEVLPIYQQSQGSKGYKPR
ncbi:MAG: M48 family metallopeptidase, partial [Planctomycetota bacterium]